MERKNTLREILDRHREQLGEAITLKEIFELYEASKGKAELSQEEREQLLNQVSADPEAALQLIRLMRFPVSAASGAPEEQGGIENRWAKFRQRLIEEGDLSQDHKLLSDKTLASTRSRHLLPIWPLAASFLLGITLTLVISNQAPWLSSSSNQIRTDIQVNLPVVELLQNDSQVSRGVNITELPESADAILITLTLRRSFDEAPFTLTVHNPHGSEIFQREGLLPGPGGVFVLTLPREGFTDGQHRLTLRQNQEPPVEFLLQINLTR